jgi:hypothetical protein
MIFVVVVVPRTFAACAALVDAEAGLWAGKGSVADLAILAALTFL